MAKNKSGIVHIFCAVWICCLLLSCNEVITDAPDGKGNVIYIPAENEQLDSVITFTVTIHPAKHFWLKQTRDTVRSVVYYKRRIQSKKSFEELSTAVRKIYRSFIGVREKTGHNDGPEIEKILASVGLHGRFAYCSAGVHYSLDKGGVPNPITGYSPTAFNNKNPIYYKGKFIKDPHFSDVVVFYYISLHRIGHAAFYDGRLNNDGLYYTVEFNTSIAGEGTDREGGGIARKIRSWNMTHAASRWISEGN